MAKILETRNYGMFELHEFNRDVKKLAILEASMKRQGWIDAFPAHVVREGGRLVIKGGHHRATVAKKLSLPIKYVVCNDTATIHELEAATTPWSIHDYMASYCRMAKPDYLEVKRYCDQTGINVSHAVSMLGGNTAGSGNFNAPFKAGTYKIRSKDHANTVAELVLHMKSCGIKFACSANLVIALSKVTQVDSFSTKQMKQKIKTFAHAITKQVNLQEYLKMLEDVYNKQSKSRVPLAFMAEEASKNRNVCRAARATL